MLSKLGLLRVGVVAVASALTACPDGQSAEKAENRGDGAVDGPMDAGEADAGRVVDGGVDNEDPTLASYLKNTWGITVGGFKNDKFSVDENGQQILSDVGTITVDGLGAKQVRTTTAVSPAEMGGNLALIVSQVDGSDPHYFRFDPMENGILIGNPDSGTSVFKSPDGTYQVMTYDAGKIETFTVADGFEALRAVEQKNGFKSISPHVLLMAFAAAHTTVPEARVPIHCSDTAVTPPVCEIFKEFCDCAACLVIDRKGPCDRCPKL